MQKITYEKLYAEIKKLVFLIALFFVCSTISAQELPRVFRENNRFHSICASLSDVWAITTHVEWETKTDFKARYYRIEISAWCYDKNGQLNAKGLALAEKIFKIAKLNGISAPLRFHPHYPQPNIPCAKIWRLLHMVELYKYNNAKSNIMG